MERTRIIALSGASADGKTSVGEGLSSKEFGKVLKSSMFKPINTWRNWCDVVIVGRSTISCDNPSLTNNLRPTAKRGVIDRFLKIDYESPLNILDRKRPTLIFTIKKPNKKLELLQNVKFIVLKKDNFFKDMKKKLRKMGMNNILFESGGNFTSLLLKEAVIDEIFFAYFPFIIGGRGPTLCDGENIDNIDRRFKLKLLNSSQADGMITAHYRVNYKK